MRGLVSLIGAGPGDAELLTLKAYKRLQQADILVYDRLVSKEILDLVPESVQRFYVGKARSMHSVPQADINQALVGWASEGKRVVRLKGGDPFIFGRGGEELEALMADNLAVEVVPGITAASGCAAYAGIPLTHRDHAQEVHLVTGHVAGDENALDWAALARSGQTLVFYMGLSSVEVISDKLQVHGLASDTPLAVIEQGTTSAQKTHVGTLACLPSALTAGHIQSPALLIVGSVVSLHSRLSWFEGQKTSGPDHGNDLH
ncbi:uroporphyrin-III C-methyltransferase/precorrin-2 dehydrogenase/sirohydrochlorin ferrochelatase/uroporphyrin-III C-methyltransferase [Vreelandella songnenensis]|uniref:uroporphyrinogen-III C-methyltransferase n=1 Tax=Vreelandella songnenensis TaxID=1176243 RepID=A0A2T0V1G7_9GAMM|nr:uroporphyrinogen-III C-methyltransferase [Halomonas songnenensis]PRY63918.1 uroporphyrin-III C-methyltransferase/precorrin-2 dehydrogenase/sirohydrochlorin ferrochelatase/uroporphyrin-III C-methyltransferase [Halomonas songnenensis]